MKAADLNVFAMKTWTCCTAYPLNRKVYDRRAPDRRSIRDEGSHDVLFNTEGTRINKLEQRA